MKGHAEKSVERYCELAHKSVEQLSEVCTPCMDDHQLTKDDFEIVRELADVCPQLGTNVFTLHESVDQTPHGQSMHWLELSPKWNRACEKRLARLISYLKCTSSHRQFCHVGDECKPGLFQDANFPGDLTDSRSKYGGMLCIW